LTEIGRVSRADQWPAERRLESKEGGPSECSIVAILNRFESPYAGE
jgi:hypothetical protein